MTKRTVGFSARFKPETIEQLEKIAQYFAAQGHKGMHKRGAWNKTRAIELLADAMSGQLEDMSAASAFDGIDIIVDPSMPPDEIRFVNRDRNAAVAPVEACPTCKGRGDLEGCSLNTEPFRSSKYTVYRYRCPECRGTGKVSS